MDYREWQIEGNVLRIPVPSETIAHPRIQYLVQWGIPLLAGIRCEGVPDPEYPVHPFWKLSGEELARWRMQCTDSFPWTEPRKIDTWLDSPRAHPYLPFLDRVQQILPHVHFVNISGSARLSADLLTLMFYFLSLQGWNHHSPALWFPVLDWLLAPFRLQNRHVEENPTGKPLLTLDVDVACALRGKPPLQIATTFLRWFWNDGPERMLQYAREWICKHEDPFTVSYLQKTAPGLLRWIHRVFLHVFPEEVRQPHPLVLQQEWNRWQEHFLCGWHPSLDAGSHRDAFRAEWEWWKLWMGSAPWTIRMHFLQVRYPEMLEWMESLGVREDWSCGWNEHPGAVAGTWQPFFPYDIQAECVRKVLLVPLAWMDRHFFQNPTPFFFRVARKILEYACRHLLLDPVLLWHNNTLIGQEAGWQKFQTLLKDLLAPWYDSESRG